MGGGGAKRTLGTCIKPVYVCTLYSTTHKLILRSVSALFIQPPVKFTILTKKISNYFEYRKIFDLKLQDDKQ
jgi:hypothetical protein